MSREIDERVGWNAAIEAAAREVEKDIEQEDRSDFYGYATERNNVREDCVARIRALKKNTN
jgi:hypothetical protein